jgi:hypothetical protein
MESSGNTESSLESSKKDSNKFPTMVEFTIIPKYFIFGKYHHREANKNSLREQASTDRSRETGLFCNTIRQFFSSAVDFQFSFALEGPKCLPT